MVNVERDEVALGLVRLVALHDEATAAHLKATAVLAARIAVQMQVSPGIVASVALAGLLHDIGKVRVSRSILLKPAELTPHEWIEMRRHAAIGATLLAGLPSLASVAEAVRGHHERMDGRGYPDGLRGDEISLEARIVAVADAFHALTTDRPYRRAVLPQAALRTLHAAARTQFDADVVGATLDLLGHSPMTRPMSA